MMKYILGTFIIGVILSFLLYFLIFKVIFTGISETDKYIDQSKELIGEKFIIDNDTLTITNFRYLPTASYYLVGEKEYAVEFVTKNLIK